MKKSVIIYIVGMLCLMALGSVSILLFMWLGSVPAVMEANYTLKPIEKELSPFTTITVECPAQSAYNRDSWLRIARSGDGRYTLRCPSDMMADLKCEVTDRGELKLMILENVDPSTRVELHTKSPLTIEVPDNAINAICMATDLCEIPVVEGLRLASLDISLRHSLFGLMLNDCVIDTLITDNIYNLFANGSTIERADIRLCQERTCDLTGDSLSVFRSVVLRSDGNKEMWALQLRISAQLTVEEIVSVGLPVEVEMMVKADEKFIAESNKSKNAEQ